MRLFCETCPLSLLWNASVELVYSMAGWADFEPDSCCLNTNILWFTFFTHAIFTHPIFDLYHFRFSHSHSSHFYSMGELILSQTHVVWTQVFWGESVSQAFNFFVDFASLIPLLVPFFSLMPFRLCHFRSCRFDSSCLLYGWARGEYFSLSGYKRSQIIFFFVVQKY